MFGFGYWCAPSLLTKRKRKRNFERFAFEDSGQKYISTSASNVLEFDAWWANTYISHATSSLFEVLCGRLNSRMCDFYHIQIMVECGVKWPRIHFKRVFSDVRTWLVARTQTVEKTTWIMLALCQWWAYTKATGVHTFCDVLILFIELFVQANG